jgi:isopenicillin-N epimerase
LCCSSPPNPRTPPLFFSNKSKANAHKWYFASKSSCVLYVRRDRQLPHVPAPAVVDNVETQAFSDRFIWTGTRDRTPYCAIQAATAFRGELGGESAIMAYNMGLARWAEAYLRALWGVTAMAPPAMHTSMSIVQIPTPNATVCGLVREALFAQGWSVSGWNTPLADPPIACYFRLSAQVFLEQSDFVALGEKVLEVIKGV